MPQCYCTRNGYSHLQSLFSDKHDSRLNTSHAFWKIFSDEELEQIIQSLCNWNFKTDKFEIRKSVEVIACKDLYDDKV